MNRRSFLQSMLVAGAGFSILPGSGRVWRVGDGLTGGFAIESIPGGSALMRDGQYMMFRRAVELGRAELAPSSRLLVLRNMPTGMDYEVSRMMPYRSVGPVEMTVRDFARVAISEGREISFLSVERSPGARLFIPKP